MTVVYLGNEEYSLKFDNKEIVLTESNIMDIVREHKDILKTEGAHKHGTVLEKQKEEQQSDYDI